MPIPYLVSIVCGDSATFFRHNFLFMYVRKQNIWKPAGHQYFIFVFYVIPGQSVFFGQFVLSENISIYMSSVHHQTCPENSNALSFYRYKSFGRVLANCCGRVQIILVRSKSFYQVQIRLFLTNFYKLDLSEMISTRPK